MRKAGCEVTFADAHKNERNEGVVCFATREDLERALDKLQGEEINGRKLKLIDDSEKRSRSRSRDRKRSRSRRSVSYRIFKAAEATLVLDPGAARAQGVPASPVRDLVLARTPARAAHHRRKRRMAADRSRDRAHEASKFFAFYFGWVIYLKYFSVDILRSRDGSPRRSASPAGNDNGNGEAEMRSRSPTPPNDD
ncbi:hypothetical protein Y032_0031g2372 [Ancylostoma ceylanicum]|nr:hypothetical protein Y032_0031g2372 [Ancylostoma ceylanicum]